MSFADLQQQINSEWKQRTRPVEPLRQRKANLCVDCGKKGFAVKMEYLGNKHVTMNYTRYDVSFSKCPKCGHQDKQFMRIEGKGKGGANSGAMFGGQ